MMIVAASRCRCVTPGLSSVRNVCAIRHRHTHTQTVTPGLLTTAMIYIFVRTFENNKSREITTNLLDRVDQLDQDPLLAAHKIMYTSARWRAFT